MQKYIENQINLFDFNKPKLKITKPIRLIELFAGIGSQAMAFESLKEAGMLSVPVETYKIVEFDEFAVKSYNAIHGTQYETSDITKIKGADLEITDKGLYEYLMFYSFPCFTEDTLVLTKRGYIPIKDIVVGDYVLTHNNRYKEVKNSKKTGIKEIWEIKGMAFDTLKCTENHPFYTRKRISNWTFSNPVWTPCRSLTGEEYFGVAINQNQIFPEYDLDGMLSDRELWQLVGEYIKDGYASSSENIVIESMSAYQMEMLAEYLKSHDIDCHVIHNDITSNMYIHSNKLSLFLSLFGKGTEDKHFPGFVFDMPVKYLKTLLDTLSKHVANGLFGITSPSRPLIYGIGQLVAKVHHAPCKIREIKNKDNPTKSDYRIIFNAYLSTWEGAFYEDGYIWFPISNVIRTGETKDVYDITVADAHSFTANGCIAHNCTDLSTAGLQKGMKRGSGTRSGLLWEVERILKELHETDSLPQILWMENVPQVVGDANVRDFNEWLRTLEAMGYHNHYDILNANDYGVPQTRNRCFMISTLEDVAYEFPHKIPLSRCIRDVLEKNVDENYYLKTQSAHDLIVNLLEREDVKGMLTIPTSMCGKHPKPLEVSPCVTTAQRGVTKHLDEGTGIVHGFDAKDLIQLGNLRDGTDNFDNPQTGRVYATEGSSPTLNTCGGGDRQPKIVETVSVIAASRGRNPENPGLRRKGMECKQSLELKSDGTSNTITTVEKDNYVFEGKVIVDDTFSEAFKPVIPVKEDCSPCLRAGNHGLKVLGNLKPDATIGQRSRLIDEEGSYPTIAATDYKGQSPVFHKEVPIDKLLKWGVLKGDTLYLIRKLTPKECFRLMGYTDKSFEAASGVVSNTQIYKQAGNAIVKQVLMALFLQMGIGDRTWNELSVAERDALVGDSFLPGR